jgi:hypothetical protein
METDVTLRLSAADLLQFAQQYVAASEHLTPGSRWTPTWRAPA